MFPPKSLVLWSIFSVAMAENQTVPRSGVPLVTGGSDSHNPDYSRSVVSLRLRKPRESWGDNHFCGGTFIAPDLVITAAHCLDNMTIDDITVVAGAVNRFHQTEDTVELKVRQIIMHELFFLLIHDIGILKLEQRATEVFPKSAQILPINKSPLAVNMKCTVIGWGRIFHEGIASPTLLYADVTIWSVFECKIMRWYALMIPGIVCANDEEDPHLNRGSCKGDSGGPLVCNGCLAGIVSFSTNFECGKHHYPGAFTDVFYYRRWIEKNSADNSKGLALILVLFAMLCALNRVH